MRHLRQVGHIQYCTLPLQHFLMLSVAIQRPTDMLRVRFVLSHQFCSSPVSRKRQCHFFTTERPTHEVFRHSSSLSCLKWKVHKLQCKKLSQYDLGDGWLVVSPDHSSVNVISTTKSVIATWDGIPQLVNTFIEVFSHQRCNITWSWVIFIVKNRIESSKFWCIFIVRNCPNFTSLVRLFLHSHSSPTFTIVLLCTIEDVFKRSFFYNLAMVCNCAEEVPMSKSSWCTTATPFQQFSPPVAPQEGHDAHLFSL